MIAGRIQARYVIAAALLGALVAAGVAAYDYRTELVSLALVLVAGRFGYLYMHRVLRIPHRRHRRRSVTAEALAALAGYLLGRRVAATHACLQCGHPIPAPSRAMYCGPACRRYAALERREVERRAAALETFGDLPAGF